MINKSIFGKIAIIFVGALIIPTFAIAQIKMGRWCGTLLGGTSSEDGGDTFVLPFVGLNFWF